MILDEGDDTHLALAGRTETTGFAGKHEEPLFPPLGAPDASKPAHRIATVKITVHHLLYNGTKVPVLMLKSSCVTENPLFLKIS